MSTCSDEQVGEQDGGVIPFAEGRDDHHDGLSGVLRPAGNPVRGGERRARGDTDEQTLFLGGTAGPLHRRVSIDVDDLVVNLTVEDLGHEVRAQTLDLVRARSAPVQDRGLLWLHRNDLDLWVASLENLADAGNGASSADSGDEDVNRAVRVLPALLRSGLTVDQIGRAHV